MSRSTRLRLIVIIAVLAITVILSLALGFTVKTERHQREWRGIEGIENWKPTFHQEPKKFLQFEPQVAIDFEFNN